MAVLFLGVAAYVGLLLYKSWDDGDWLKEGDTAVEEEEEEEIFPVEEVLSYPATP